MDRIKLLIIEDDTDQRELLCQTLEGHFGDGTTTGAATLAETLANPLAEFDLILCDYHLPDANGIELLKAVRARCSTPVILVTGENVDSIAIQAIREGATDYVVKLGDYLFAIPLVVQKNLTAAKLRRENDSLRSELEKALSEVKTKNSQLVESLLRVEEMAATDPLTKLYNRRHFSRVIEQLFAEAQRYNQDLACVMIDMDGFKQLNDTRGHQVGDELLACAGRVVLDAMRKMDVAARYGGDELVLLLPHASTQDAAAAAERIRSEFRSASAKLLGREHGVSMSVGIASLQLDRPANADGLIGSADAALYKAKAAGRDRIVWTNAPMFPQTPAGMVVGAA